MPPSQQIFPSLWISPQICDGDDGNMVRSNLVEKPKRKAFCPATSNFSRQRGLALRPLTDELHTNFDFSKKILTQPRLSRFVIIERLRQFEPSRCGKTNFHAFWRLRNPWRTSTSSKVSSCPLEIAADRPSASAIQAACRLLTASSVANDSQRLSKSRARSTGSKAKAAWVTVSKLIGQKFPAFFHPSIAHS